MLLVRRCDPSRRPTEMFIWVYGEGKALSYGGEIRINICPTVCGDTVQLVDIFEVLSAFSSLEDGRGNLDRWHGKVKTLDLLFLLVTSIFDNVLPEFPATLEVQRRSLGALVLISSFSPSNQAAVRSTLIIPRLVDWVTTDTQSNESDTRRDLCMCLFAYLAAHLHACLA
jgi:hypothetical protein